MKLQYDPDFIEGAVFVFTNVCGCNAPPPLQVRRFHAARERLYSILDPEEREAAFFKLQLEWFREWRLELQLIGLADEFPRLRSALSALVFRKARARSDEGAELYVNSENGRSGVVAFCVERFSQPEELARFLRHEFMHLHDMVDPAFGYSPQLRLPGQNAAQQRLTRERYRLLWDITIDGRLANANRSITTTEEQHRLAFDRVFSFWPDARREEVFHSLWNGTDPHHDQLIGIAADPRDLRQTEGPLPGAPCPLCDFPTFHWIPSNEIVSEVADAISVDFPQWNCDRGVCNRCYAIYEKEQRVCSH